MSKTGVFYALVTFRAGITSDYTNTNGASDLRPDLCLPAGDLEPFGKHFRPCSAFVCLLPAHPQALRSTQLTRQH